MFTNYIYLIHMNKPNLVLYNQQWLIYHKTQPNLRLEPNCKIDTYQSHQKIGYVNPLCRELFRVIIYFIVEILYFVHKALYFTRLKWFDDNLFVLMTY